MITFVTGQTRLEGIAAWSALPRGGDPFGLALVLQSFSDGGSEAALQEGITDQDFYPQPSRSSADIQALGVIPKVCRKRATNAPGC
jgi:hypothetical protein